MYFPLHVYLYSPREGILLVENTSVKWQAMERATIMFDPAQKTVYSFIPIFFYIHTK